MSFEKFPIPILRSICGTLQSARQFVSGRKKDSPLHYKLREASETMEAILKLQENEDQPFWYTLYEGIIGKYIHLKYEHKNLQIENDKYRQENHDLREKYWDAIKKIEKESAESEEKIN